LKFVRQIKRDAGESVQLPACTIIAIALIRDAVNEVYS
jgi:hypothetical protein